MDDSRFDAWTRRRVGRATAGMAAALIAMLNGEDAPAKRKRKKRKRLRAHSRQCEPLGTDCNPHNDRRICCADLICGQVDSLGRRRCCRDRQGPCRTDADCCHNMSCLGAPEGRCEWQFPGTA